jgi:hypothetical protein
LPQQAVAAAGAPCMKGSGAAGVEGAGRREACEWRDRPVYACSRRWHRCYSRRGCSDVQVPVLPLKKNAHLYLTSNSSRWRDLVPHLHHGRMLAMLDFFVRWPMDSIKTKLFSDLHKTTATPHLILLPSNVRQHEPVR